MKILQTRNGFTFIEAVLAIAIFATLSVAVLSVVNSTFFASYITNSKVSSFFYIKNMFFDPANYSKFVKNAKDSIKNSIKDVNLDLTYSLNQDKILDSEYQGCYRATIIGETSGLRDIEQEIDGIVFVQKEKK